MVKLSNRFISLFIALIMCIGICPIQVYAEDREFTLQPESTVTISANTLTYNIPAKTSFVPTYVEVVWYSMAGTTEYNDVSDAEITITGGDYIYVKLPSSSRTIAYYRIRAYYDETHYISSSRFMLSDSSLIFTEQPESTVNMSTDTLKYHASASTSFIPTKIRLQRRSMIGTTEYETVTDAEITRADKHITVKLPPSSSLFAYYQILAYYDETHYKVSDSFVLNDSSLAFTEQPESTINMSTDTNKYHVSAATSFIPTKIRVYWRGMTGSSEYQLVSDAEITRVGKQITVKLPSNSNTIAYYQIRAYYDESNFKVSDSFTLDQSSMVFTEQPESTISASPDTLKYHISAATSFAPTKIEVYSHSIVGNPNTTLITDAEITRTGNHISVIMPARAQGFINYQILAYYDETNAIPSDSFSLSNSSLVFTQQPDPTISISPASQTYRIYASTSFVPKKIEVHSYNIAGDPDSAQVTDAEISRTGNNITVTLPKPSTYFRKYQIIAYYGDENFIGSDTFTLSNGYFEFTKEPEDVLYRENYGLITDTVRWSTNFTPTKVEILKYRSVSQPLFSAYTFDYALEKTLTSGMSEEMALSYDIITSLGYGDYKIKIYYVDSEYISSYFKIYEPKFTVQPQSGTAAPNGKYTVKWETNIPAEFISDVRIDNERAPGITNEFYYPDEDAASWEITLTDGEDVKDYYVSVYYYFTPDYNSNYILSTLSSENFNVERFKFTKEPGGTVVDGEFTENANVVPCGGSLRLSWDTTGKNIRYEVIYAPTDGSAEPVTVELNNRKYYDFESPNEYKDYTCFVRAWLDDDVQLISRMFTIHCEGISADIELNGGSYGAAVSADGEWIREKQQKLNANSDGIAALPECTIVPPEGMMFDKWCVTDHKAFLMAQDSASEQPFITENLLVNGEYGFPTYDFYYPGANISVQSGYTYIFPIWKPRVYEWVGGDISKVFDEEPLTFCLNDSVSPFIPSEFFDFCYEEDSFEPKEPDWQIMYSASVDGETEFYYMEIEPVLDENAAGGVRFRAWGPSDIGSYALILMYKGETKHVIPFRITDEHEGQLEVDEYKANGTYPTQDGAIFAGWFADSEYTTAYTEDTGYAYAKFIAEECLTIRWQVPTDFADQDTTDIRLITSLDCGKYDSLHIVLKYTDTDALISDGKCTRLLDTVNGYVDSSNVEYRPEDVFCEDSHYFGAYKVTGMPKEKYDSSLTAYAYIVTQDGTVVNGSALTFKVSSDPNYHE